MKVTIDVQTLFIKLKTFNPDVDLTGVKAYLFDAMMNQASGGPEATQTGGTDDFVLTDLTPRTMAEGPGPVTGPSDEQGFDLDGEDEEEEEAPGPSALPSVLDKVLGVEKAATTGRSVMTPRVVTTGGKPAKDRLESRRSRRESAAQFSNMTSKEILEAMHNQAMPKKNEQNQFLSEGTEAGATSGGEDSFG